MCIFLWYNQLNLLYILSNPTTLICPDGSQRNGSIVPKPVAAWAFRSGPFAVCNSSMTTPTAPCTASTAAGRSQRAGGPVTEFHVLPNGGPEHGQRFSIQIIYLKEAEWQIFCQTHLYFGWRQFSNRSIRFINVNLCPVN